MNQVVERLKSMILTMNKKKNDYQTVDSKVNKIPSIISANEIIESLALLKEKFSIIVNKLVELISENLNEGKEVNEVKQHVIDYLDNHNINSQATYDLLLSNQDNSNSIFLLGYFNYYGILAKNKN